MDAYRTELERLASVINAVREMDPVIPPQTVQILLIVAAHPGIRPAELAQRTGIERSSVSRNVNALGEHHRNGKPGLGLVEQAMDPEDRRASLIYLTPKGRGLVRRLLAIEMGRPTEDFTPPTAREARLQGYR